ncbi:MAG: AAA family ATPase [Acidobacteriota bacterium]|nr:AAA family ATPase [Acidobacteriota bacterium]
MESITDERRVREVVREATNGQHIRLNDNQREAIEIILTSRDRIIGLQGSAGTGKTTTLSVLKQAVERSGYDIKGYAPTTKAVKQLSESGIETQTLQKFIRQWHASDKALHLAHDPFKAPHLAHDPRAHNLANDPHALGTGRYQIADSSPDSNPNASRKLEGDDPGTSGKGQTKRNYRTRDKRTLYVLDESSLASSRNLHTFFDRIGPEDKVLLVGDVRQHQAIEAGSPLEQLQQHGMRTAKLTKIVRQTDASLKRVVEHLSARQIHAAVTGLRAGGRVIEIPDEHERLQCIARDYVAQPEGALVISPANKERVAINMMIRRQPQEQGGVSRGDHATSVYVNRQEMTGAERTFAGAYVPGEDIIRYNTRSKVYGVRTGEYGRMTANNYAENTITVTLESGREITYNPQRLSGVSVYREAEREFAEGDRIQFRAPLQEHRVVNNELGRIEHIEGRQFTVALDDGRRVQFDAGEFRHLDHGYAVTSYSSQGETVDRVIINANTNEPDVLLNQRMSYVAVSRAREDAVVYTNSADELGEALDRQVDKEMALNAWQSGQLSKSTSQQVEHAPDAHVHQHSHSLPERSRTMNAREHGYAME